MKLVTGRYVDDHGRNWAMAVGEEYFDQAGLGWTASEPEDLPFSSASASLKPRVVICRASSGETRRIVAATAACGAYSGSLNTIDISHDDDATGYLATIYGWEGERTRNRRPPAPAQA